MQLATSQVRKLAARLATLHSWLLCWEIYLIILVAAFLRLYQLNATEFDTDQADLFQTARYAATHGLIPATGNVASVGVYIQCKLTTHYKEVQQKR